MIKQKLPQKLTLPITKKDIMGGVTASSLSCPVALCLNREYPLPQGFYWSAGTKVLSLKQKHSVLWCETIAVYSSEDYLRFINSFDKGLPTTQRVLVLEKEEEK